jgi:cytochrome P450
MPANTSIIITTSLLQRSKEVWGENADEFDIDRWLDGSVSERDELKFQAWNIGPRMVR